MTLNIATDPLMYPITDEQRAVLFQLQRGRCAICGSTEEADYALVVDHDHDTGIVRGLLCRLCNTGLGFLNDNPQVLRSALTYLEHFKPDHDRVVTDVEQIVRFRPRVSLCEGSYEPVENLNGGIGPGLFRCAVCDRPDIKVRSLGRRGSKLIYVPKAHYPRDAVPRPRGFTKHKNKRW